MSKNYYASGQWNFICDSCGQKLKSSRAKKRWDGFVVCSECWEPRHSQDFLRAKKDKISVPWVRPITDVFLPINFTETLLDTFGLNDAVFTEAVMYRDVPNTSGGTTEFEASEINGFAINGSAIGGTPAQMQVNTVYLTEVVETVTGYNVSLSDSVTLSEVVHEGENEGIMESTTLSEVISLRYNTSTAINGSSINAQGIN